MGVRDEADEDLGGEREAWNEQKRNNSVTFGEAEATTSKELKKERREFREQSKAALAGNVLWNNNATVIVVEALF